MAAFEFFKKEFKFRGKHARMAGELWQSNDYEHTYFKRLIDLYMVAAVVGFRVDRQAEEDYSPFEEKSIFPEQMIHAKEDLDYLMQMMIMLDYRDSVGTEESVKMAFRGPQSKEEFGSWQNRFNSYVRGGVEELYERFIVRKSEVDDEYYENKTSNIMELLKRFDGTTLN